MTAPFRLAAAGALLLTALCVPAPAEPSSPFRPVEPVQTRRSGPTGGASSLPPKVDERLRLFFSTLASQTVEQAFFKLFEGTQFAQEKDAIDSFTKATRDAINAYGKIKYFDLFETRRIGERMILVSEIAEHERRVVRWRFLFYSPIGNEWSLINLKVDDLRNFTPASPSPARPPEDVVLRNEKFFINLQSGDPAAAFRDLTAGTELAAKNEVIAAFVERTQAALKEYGKIASYELIDTRPLNPRHRLLTYVAATEKEPLRWQLFYRLDPASGSWTLTNVRVDDLFDEAFLID